MVQRPHEGASPVSWVMMSTRVTDGGIALCRGSDRRRGGCHFIAVVIRPRARSRKGRGCTSRGSRIRPAAGRPPRPDRRKRSCARMTPSTIDSSKLPVLNREACAAARARSHVVSTDIRSGARRVSCNEPESAAESGRQAMVELLKFGGHEGEDDRQDEGDQHQDDAETGATAHRVLQVDFRVGGARSQVAGGSGHANCIVMIPPWCHGAVTVPCPAAVRAHSVAVRGSGRSSAWTRCAPGSPRSTSGSRRSPVRPCRTSSRSCSTGRRCRCRGRRRRDPRCSLPWP